MQVPEEKKNTSLERAIQEIYSTEATFVSEMEAFRASSLVQSVLQKKPFKINENKAQLNPDQKNQLKDVIEEICGPYENPFLSKEKDEAGTTDIESELSRLLEHFENKTFGEHLINLKNGLFGFYKLTKLIEKTFELTEFKRAEIPEKNSMVDNFVIMPTQRIPRYIILMEAVCKEAKNSDLSKQIRDRMDNVIAELREFCSQVNKEKMKVEAQDAEAEIAQHKKGNAIDQGMAFLKSIANSKFDTRKFVEKLFHFENNRFYPFTNKGDLRPIRKAVETGKEFADFREWLKLSGISELDFSNFNAETALEKSDYLIEQKHPNSAAALLSLVLISDASSWEKLKAWQTILQLTTLSSFCFYIKSIFSAKEEDFVINVNAQIERVQRDLKIKFTDTTHKLNKATDELFDTRAENDLLKKQCAKCEKENEDLKKINTDLQQENERLSGTLELLSKSNDDEVPAGPQDQAAQIKPMSPNKNNPMQELHDLLAKFYLIKSEIGKVKSWQLGFFGRLVGARRFHFGDGSSKKMATGAYEILNIIQHNQIDPFAAKKKILEVLETRVDRKDANDNKYVDHSSRSPETKALYQRLYNILTRDLKPTSPAPSPVKMEL